MKGPRRIGQHVNGDLRWFIHTRFCRAVAQVVIVALVLVDAPLHLLKDAFARSAIVFGPEALVRQTGAPQTVTRTFNVATPSGPFTLCLYNGGPDYLRVSSAIVTLNNTQVLRTNDFSQTVVSLSRPVSLRATNTLRVEVRSRPGSGFTLSIVAGTTCTDIPTNTPPSANAGPDDTVRVGTTVELDGSGSTDVDGDHLTFTWTLVQKPADSVATLSDPNAIGPTFLADRPGRYEVQLIVNDGKVDSAPDTVVVSTINSKPVADAGDDQTVPPGSTVTLNGSDSSDVDGDTLTYRWTLLSKPTDSTAALADDDTDAPSFTADKPGTYTVELIVNDGTVDSEPDTVVISTANSRPVADAGDDQTGTVGQLVTLDGSQSFDADNEPLEYQWTFIMVPNGSNVTFSDPAARQPTFTPDQPGLYIVQLVVNDTHINSEPDTVMITVSPVTPVNQPPVANAGLDQSVNVGATVNLDGTGSSDPDNDSLTYQWTFTITPDTSTATLTNADTSTPSFVPDVAGPYSVQLTVNDGKGRGDTDSVDITVTVAPPTNQPPTITSTAITTATMGQAYSYDVEATDPDAGDTLAYSLTTKPANMTIDANTGVISWTPAADQTGSQNVTVQVSDGHPGGTATQSFSIVVSAAPANRPPVAQDDQYAVRRGQTLTVPAPGVLGNDTDPDNNPLTAHLVTGATKGTANLATDGSLTYTPTPPPANSTEPVLKFAVSGTVINPGNTTTGTTGTEPLVIDLDKDGVAEIVAHMTAQFGVRRLFAVHGNDGSVAFSVNTFQPTANPPIVLESSSELAAGDIDGDGFPEIIAVDGHDGGHTGDPFRRQLVAFEHDGTYKWTSQDVVDDPLIDSTSGFTKPLITDINGDGTPEIVVRYFARGPLTPAGLTGEDYVTVFDYQGRIVWTARGGGANAGDQQGNVIVHDIDLDGDLEILASDDVFDHQGQLLWSAGTCASCLNIRDVAVANLDNDPFAEIVYMDHVGRLYVYEHTGVRKWGPVNAGTIGSGAYLTVGDVDGDSHAEIVLTTGGNIQVVSRDGASLRTIPVSFSTIFNSPRSTIFDLNGDGKPELIHLAARGSFDFEQGGGDTGALMIFDGQTGTHLHSIKSRNEGQPTDGPVVADVDGDGAAEIVTAGDAQLINVFEAKNGQWAKARPIYNQYHYSVTNVNSDGTIPAHPAINWLTPGLNNYRVNIPLPEERTDDKDQFTYNANDGQADSNTATVKIDILPPNTAPSILSQAPIAASPNLEYLYAVRAVDPDAGEVLTFSLAQASTGMTINAATGLIRWTPTTGQVGNHVVALKVTDSQNQSAFQGFTITVGAPVTVPDVLGETQAAAQTAITGAGLRVGTITNSPSSTVPAGSVISQEPSAGTAVPSGSAVDLVVSSGPQGVSVPNVVGQTQTAAQTAITSVGLTVGTVTTAPSTTVAAGNVISQTPAAGTTAVLGTSVDLVVSVGIITLDGLTSIVVEPVSPLILVSGTHAFTATGIFSDGSGQNLTAIVTWTSSSPSVASIAANGVATGLVDGTTTISATVGSISGNTTLTVRAKVPGDFTEPTATITTPTGGAEVTSPIDVIGTATDANFLKYELAYAPAGETTFTLLSTGTTAVTNGVLGKLDPTLLINDLYDLKLTVLDRGGNEASATVTVQVTREQKVGLFTITFQDLSIPLSGIPITINRTYDSRDKGQGDFGIGWRLDIQTLRIRTNRVLGTGWVRQQSGAVTSLVPTDEHKVSLTLPDGRVEEFDTIVSPTSNIGSLDFTNVTGFAPRPGTLGTLTALANNSLLIVNAGAEDELVDDGTLNTYNPQLFRYTSADGTQIEIHRTEGVKKVTDLNGNTLTFGPNGITHSAGKSVAFTRDTQGRITQITDPSGNSRSYSYNANGDLSTATDFVGNTTRFTYNSTHGLLDIVDPTGARVARNEYNSSGRLIATTDAQGNRIEFTHNLNASQEVVRDRLGNVTVLEYDAVGNVVAKTDALGGHTTYTYDSQGNQLTETDPLGRVASKTYDTRRNVLSSTDFDGNTTTFSYNARNQVLTTRDPEGRTTTNVYDANGNLTQITDPEGGITRHTYNAAGNRLTTTDPLGDVTTFTYDANGNQTSETDALGTVTTSTYNTNGTILSETKAGRTTQFQYDAAQRLTRATNALGHQTLTSYSAIGDGQKPASTTDANGNVTTFAYDARGNLTSTTFPDGSATAAVYDAEARALSQTDRDGRTTAFQYDALGRQTRITNPDGTTVLKSYDAVGHLLSQTDERGNITTYSYAPNKQTVTDALGNVTVHEFDSQRRRTKTTDALGRIITFAYDSRSNLTRITFPDGRTQTATYDLLGRKTAETDQAGRSFQFAYDALGQLIRVTDASGGVTTYTYDALGNRLTQTDSNNHATQLAYDVLGQLLTRTRPLGQQETFTYDANGNQLTHTDFNGQTTTFTYNAVNRLTQKALPGGTVVPYAFTGSGLRTQAGGDSYIYDTRGRLTQETKAAGEVLSYTYDAAGNKTSLTTPQGTTTYTYDALNRLATVVDTTGTTTYTYDDVGNLASTAYPNGVTTTYSYNTLNRLLQMTSTGPAGLISSYTYTLGAAGNRLQVVEAGPATTGRTVSYTYDAVYRLTQEAIDEPGTANDQTITYSYDAVGNRTQMNRNGTITSSTYDSNDRLLTETTGSTTTTHTYNANGSMLTKSGGGLTDTYTYDAENRLISAGVQSGTNPGPASYTYDADGMRTSKTAGGVTTTFLLDKNRDYAQVLVETTGSTAVTYSYGHDLVSQTRPGTGTRFYQYDGQLSTRQLTSTTGGVTDTYTYDAFGVLLSSTGSTPNNYLYTGEQLDPNVGFYYLRARYYNQTTGRFATTDPEEGNVFDPVSLHRYLYTNGDPVNKLDPSGAIVVPLAVLIAGLVILDTIGALVGTYLFFSTTAKKAVGGRTNTFTLNLGYGFQLGIGTGFGYQDASITERGVPRPRTAYYKLYFFGVGAGVQLLTPSTTPFSTIGTRQFHDFEGPGTVFNAGVGLSIKIVNAGLGYTRFVLPEGTEVITQSGFSGTAAKPSNGLSLSGLQVSWKLGHVFEPSR